MRKITLVALLTLLSFGFVKAQTYDVCDTATPTVISDFTTITSVISVSETGTIGPLSNQITFSRVQQVLQHDKAGDLIFTLESPAGTTLELSSNNGGVDGLDAEDTLLFLDSSPNDITTWTGGAPAASYQAEEGLLMDTFAGEEINGDWTITIQDGGADGEGELVQSCLRFIENGVIGSGPIITCPSDVVDEADAGTCATEVTFSDATAFDPEDGQLSVTQTMGPVSGSSFPVGVTTIEFSATDSDGNTATCSFTITIEDNENPVAVCQDITVELDAMGMASITAADVDNGSSDNCGIDMLTIDVTDFTCSDVGANTVTLTVTDVNGNSSDCTATVTVVDVTAPVVECQGGLLSENEDFEDAMIPAGWTQNVLQGVQEWTFGSGNNPTGPDFPTNAAIFNDDAAGSGNVNAAELLSPTYDLTGSTDATLTYDVSFVELGAGETFTVEVWDGSAWQVVTVYDTTLTEITSESFDVTAFANDAFQVRYTYDDAGSWGWSAGVDNFALTYNSPSAMNLEVVLDANGMASIPAEDLIITPVDEACNFNVTAGGGNATPMTLETTFAGGNGLTPGGNMFDINAINDITISSFDVNIDGDDTVEVYFKTGTHVGFETDASAWTFLDDATVITNGANVATPLDLDLGQFVAAGETVAFYVTTTSASINYTNGTTLGNVLASDANLEFLEGSGLGYPFGPSVFAPRNFNGNVHYTVGAPAATTVDFDCSQVGVVSVPLTVTDASGNTATCTATVNVVDNTAPDLVCMDIDLEIGADGTAVLDPLSLIDPSSVEACGYDIATVDVQNFDCSDIGTTTEVTLFVSDPSGNVASCTAMVTPVDLLAPEVTCPADQTRPIDPATGQYVMEDFIASGDVMATDNCTDAGDITLTQDPAPGTGLGVDDYTVTITAEDEYGNVSTCEFNLEVGVMGVEDNALANAVSIYPNPANEQFTLANGSNIVLDSATIVDINGRVVRDINLTNMVGSMDVNVADLATGVYIVKISGEGAVTTKRLIKE